MISDASGELEITEVSGMPLTQDMLNAQVRLMILYDKDNNVSLTGSKIYRKNNT